ncbi:MAG: hypothetical protein AAFX45_09545 [Pseudomonadota bacterium]
MDDFVGEGIFVVRLAKALALFLGISFLWNACTLAILYFIAFLKLSGLAVVSVGAVLFPVAFVALVMTFKSLSLVVRTLASSTDVFKS